MGEGGLATIKLGPDWTSQRNMSFYAQTNLQLYNQLQETGYSHDDVWFVRKTYDLAAQLFSGRFQESGKEQLAHCVGTTSILASLGQSVEILSAGLIHNVYRTGDFGDGEHGITKKRQEYICHRLGLQVESLVASFYRFRWGEKFLPLIHSSLSTMSPLEQDTILLYLADNLDHNLYHGACYYSLQKRSLYFSQNWKLAPAIANKLGFPSLAHQLEEVQRQNATTQLPPEFQGAFHLGGEFIMPRSLKRRELVLGREYWKKGTQWVRYSQNPGVRFLRRVVRKLKNTLSFV